jgi:TolA-binding protein
MSLFSKKPELDQPRSVTERGHQSSGSAYGIAEAIQLMRTLPVEQNVELVVGVVRNTLESMNVHLPEIINDASMKQESIQERIANLQAEISELTQQVETRRQEIAGLETELAETTLVKDRLLLAQGAQARSKAPEAEPSRSGQAASASEPPPALA